MKRLITYGLLLIVLSYIVRELLYYGVRQNKIGEYDKLNTIFYKENSFDNIIIGSSRAESHFDPNIIEALAGLQTYNLGMEGEFMPLINGILSSYLINSNAPKRVFLNIDVHPYTGEIVVNRFPRFFPYLDVEPLYKALQKTDQRFWAFKYIPFYSMAYFNDKYLNASVRGFTGIESVFDKTFVKGYVPIPDNMYTNVDTANYTPFLSSPQAIVFSSLDSIIRKCRSINAELYFVFTPIYIKGYEAIMNGKELTQRFKNIAKEHEITVLDYTHDSICKDPSYFADPYHLNKVGAEKFSAQFATDIKQYL